MTTPPQPGQIYEGYADHVEMVEGVWTGGSRPLVGVVRTEFQRKFSPERPQQELKFKPSTRTTQRTLHKGYS